MTQIKKMPEKDYEVFVDIIAEACPGFGIGTPEVRNMRFFDFNMNIDRAYSIS